MSLLAVGLALWHTQDMRPLPIHELAGKVLACLKQKYPETGSQLEYANPWELLVATVLAAQCTDARVNMVTPKLFARWPGPGDLAGASLEDLEETIRSTGFFHNKAKNLVATARIIHTEYDDEVPREIEKLVKLPGLARKTANVVLFGGYGINAGLAVDTHVKRISYRLGLTRNTDPVKIEKDLMEIFPQNEWGDINHRMVWFGREVCQARKPACDQCVMKAFCQRLEPPRQAAKTKA